MANGTTLLTVKEAAEYLRINVYTLYAWRRQQKGPPMYKLQAQHKSQWRIPKDNLDQWIESKKE